MSSQATIANIAQFVDQEVTLNGWLYNIRGSGKIAFPPVSYTHLRAHET